MHDLLRISILQTWSTRFLLRSTHGANEHSPKASTEVRPQQTPTLAPWLICVALLLQGCTLSPLAREWPEPQTQAVALGHSRVVFLNEDARIYLGEPVLPGNVIVRDLSNLSGTGRINVLINGKALGQANIGEYLQVDLPFGEHEVKLIHYDVFTFESKHSIRVYGAEQLFIIYPTVVSNWIEEAARNKGLNGYRPAAKRK